MKCCSTHVRVDENGIIQKPSRRHKETTLFIPERTYRNRTEKKKESEYSHCPGGKFIVLHIFT